MGFQASRLIVAYDASCGPCTRFKEAVDFLDAKGLLEFVPLEEADASGLLEGTPESSRFSSFHLLRRASSGLGPTETWSGAEALLPLIRLLSPLGGTVARLVERAPGGVAAATFAYSQLSRLHLSCPVAPGRGNGIR